MAIEVLIQTQKEKNEDITNPRLGAALDYARRTWPVIPLKSFGQLLNGKIKTKDYGMVSRDVFRLEKPTLDPDEIRKYWTEWPDANVGLQTGRFSGLLVLNIHPSVGRGAEGIVDFLNRHYGVPQHSAVVVNGLNGIKHYLYSHPGEKEQVPCGSLCPGITLGGEAGYFVAPPSSFPFSQTSWGLPDGSKAFLPFGFNLQLPPAPLWLCTLFS
jgi:hypothetical protein